MLDLGLKKRFGTCTLPHGRVPHDGHVTVTTFPDLADQAVECLAL